MFIDNFVNPYTLNIFCDASTFGTYACYGAVAVNGNTIIDEIYRVQSNSTCNNAEVRAIKAGISLALRYQKNFQCINIFSDNENAILCIRERVMNWRVVGNTLIGSSNNPIVAQNLYIEMVLTINEAGLSVNFWHQKGHVNSGAKSLSNALYIFKTNNGPIVAQQDIEIGFIKYISYFNNLVDKKSRDLLHNQELADQIINPLVFYPNNFKQEQKEYRARQQENNKNLNQ